MVFLWENKVHRAEEILSAVVTALTGLATTGASVERDRVYPAQSCPALSIEQGGEEPIQGRENMQFQDSALEVEVAVYVKSQSLNTQLNQIKAEVYAALMANRQLGLAYVYDLQWLGDTAPEPNRDSDSPTTKCSMRFAVAYRHSLTSKETS